MKRRPYKECPVCGYWGACTEYCNYDWDAESPSSPRIILWGVGIGLAALVMAYVIISCSPATPIHGPHDCSVAGYHKHDTTNIYNNGGLK